MECVPLGELAKRKEMLRDTLEKHRFVNLTDEGDEPVAVALKPEFFTILLAMVEDMGASLSKVEDAPPHPGYTVSAAEFIAGIE